MDEISPLTLPAQRALPPRADADGNQPRTSITYSNASNGDATSVTASASNGGGDGSGGGGGGDGGGGSGDGGGASAVDPGLSLGWVAIRKHMLQHLFDLSIRCGDMMR